MKLINLLLDRFSVVGIIAASALFFALSLIMLLHLFFDFSTYQFMGKLSGEYKQGIAIPVDFNTAVGADTVNLNYKTDFPFNQIQTRGNTVSKIDFETGTAYIKPTSFQARSLLLLPQCLFFLLLAYFSWQLAFFIDNIRQGKIFTKTNYLKLRNLGFSLLAFEILMFIIYIWGKQFYISLQFKSTLTNFQNPIFMIANPNYHLGWGYFLAALFIMIIAKAFYTGYQIQHDQDLTI